MSVKPELIILDTMNFGWNTLGSTNRVIAQVDVITINDEEADS